MTRLLFVELNLKFNTTLDRLHDEFVVLIHRRNSMFVTDLLDVVCDIAGTWPTSSFPIRLCSTFFRNVGNLLKVAENIEIKRRVAGIIVIIANKAEYEWQCIIDGQLMTDATQLVFIKGANGLNQCVLDEDVISALCKWYSYDTLKNKGKFGGYMHTIFDGIHHL